MNRDFKGIWIPREIWVSKELSMQEKVFLAEIHSLDNENGCIASNAYFAEFFGLSKSSVSRVVSSLSKKGLIDVKLLYKPNKEVDKRVIRCKKYGDKEVKVIEREMTIPKAPSMSVGFVSEIIDYLNEKADKRLRVGLAIKKLVNARCSEGYVLDDFKHVIDVKCSQWLGTDFEKFLRPSTLFSATKFCEYHSEKLKASKEVKAEEITNSQIGFYNV